MRVGFNPNRDKEIKKSDYFHQVIIPVYIPNSLGYFADALRILQICLNSLCKTSHAKTFISIIDNGSCEKVSEYLHILKKEGKIHELIQTAGIGKLNAVFKGLSGHKFPLITISDSDVLFLNHWQKSTYDIFENFDKAGAVCPVPSSKSFNVHTSNIFVSKLFSNTLQFTPVQDTQGLRDFAASIGNPNFYNESHLQNYLTILERGKRAVVGAGHFICTYRGEVFWNRSENYSNYSMGGDSEHRFLDTAVVRKNLWRLSTQENLALHMGNVYEDWMSEKLSNIEINEENFENVSLAEIPIITLLNIWSNFIMQKIINQKSFRNLILNYKGLPKSACEKY